jgi:methyl-accepting chemotaxis protein
MEVFFKKLIGDCAPYGCPKGPKIGIEEVNRAITQMDQVTQQNAALVEEAAAAGSMQDQSARLAQVVGGFKLDGRAAQSFATPQAVPGKARTAITAPKREGTKKAAAPKLAGGKKPAALPAVKSDWEEF